MTDKEIAILVKYRIKEYLMPTQLEIYDYAKERKLTPDRITELTSDYNSSDFQKKPSSTFQKFRSYLNKAFFGIIERL